MTPAPTDFARLAAIHHDGFTTPRPWSAAEIADLAQGPHGFLLTSPHTDPQPGLQTGPQTGQIEGFLLGRVIAGEAELLTIAVTPGARRRGHGRALISAFLDEAQARGADVAFLEVSAENPAAIAAYDSSGFATAGIRRGYYVTPDGRRIDAHIMQRKF